MGPRIAESQCRGRAVRLAGWRLTVFLSDSLNLIDLHSLVVFLLLSLILSLPHSTQTSE